MFVRRNVTVAAVVGALALTACGASSGEDATPASDAPVAETTPPTDTAEALSPTPTEADSAAPTDTDAPTVTDAPPASVDDAESASEPAASEPAVSEPPATEPPATEPPATVPPPAEIGGRAFAEALSATSDIASNPLPDLLVDDIRRSTKVNLRNVFPADRPVLIWMWAPH